MAKLNLVLFSVLSFGAFLGNGCGLVSKDSSQSETEGTNSQAQQLAHLGVDVKADHIKGCSTKYTSKKGHFDNKAPFKVTYYKTCQKLYFEMAHAQMNGKGLTYQGFCAGLEEIEAGKADKAWADKFLEAKEALKCPQWYVDSREVITSTKSLQVQHIASFKKGETSSYTSSGEGPKNEDPSGMY
jgi:hypothetical protein